MSDAYTSITEMLPFWPGPLGNPAFLNEVYLHEYRLDPDAHGVAIAGKLFINHDLSFPFLGIKNLTIDVLKSANGADIPIAMTLAPAISVSLQSLSFSLTMQQDFLKVMRKSGSYFVPDEYTPGVPKPLRIDIGGVDVSCDDRGNIDVQGVIDVELSPFQIGSTGIIVEATGIELFLSEFKTAPGRVPSGFHGFAIKNVTIHLPDGWSQDVGHSTARLGIEDVLIGTGGISGRIVIEDLSQSGQDGVLVVRIGSLFELSLYKFSLGFAQNSISESTISGILKIPSLKGGDGEPLAIDVALDIVDDGFRIVGATGGLFGPLLIPNVLAFSPQKIGMGNEGNLYYVESSGLLDITAEIPGIGGRFIDEPIEIKKFVIWSNGEIDFEAGAIPLPKIKPLKLGPVELSVSALHIGSHEGDWQGVTRKYKYIGFDGGVKTGIGGVDARGEGIKFYFTVDNGPGKELHTYLSIDAIRVHLVIPGGATKELADLILDGYVSAKNRENDAPELSQGEKVTERVDTEKEYTGGVDLTMPRTGFRAGADLRMTPSTGAFLADVRVELPSGIPLGNTGLGIFGFRGTVGNKYIIEKGENENWWEFYKKPKLGIDATKFTPKKGFTVGAGVSLGTLADSGRAFSAKLYFMLSLPSAFLLEGQAALMSKRVGLDTEGDPPFYAVIILDFDEGSVTAGIGAHVQIPDGGAVLDLQATMELAFYFGRSSGWHIYLGQEEKEKRIRGQLLKLIDCWTYFMLSASGIKAGAGVEFSKRIDAGIASVGIGASMEITGFVSFRPIQLGGRIALAGFAELKLFGVGFRLVVSALLEAEAPKPFIIRGSFSAELDLPWPIPNIGLSLSFSWYIDSSAPLRTETLFMLPPHPELTTADDVASMESTFGIAGYRALGKYAAKAVHMVTGESFVLNAVKRTYRPANPGDSLSTPLLPPAPLLGPPIDSEGPAVPAVEQWMGTFNDFTVPVDSFIDLDFTKPVWPLRTQEDSSRSHEANDRFGLICGGKEAKELIPPKRGASNQIRHQYFVDNVRIFYWDFGAHIWRPYDPAEIDTPLQQFLSSQDLHDKLKFGYYQLSEAGEYTRLRVLAKTPFDQNDRLPLVEMGFPSTVVLCPDEGVELTCHTWDEVVLPKLFTGGQKEFDRRLSVIVHDDNAPVKAYESTFGTHQSLRIARGNTAEFFLPGQFRRLDIKMTTEADRVAVSYYRGTAYTPAMSGGRNGNTEQWVIQVPPPAELEPRDGVWEMMMGMPALVRTLCTGAGAPVAGVAAAALDTLVNQKYLLTDIYLKQNNHEPELPATADFCTKLRSMFRTIAIGKTGTTATPRRLASNVEHFYADVKRLTADYRKVNGDPVLGGLAAANEFYEKWRGLIVCLGKLLDARGTIGGDRLDLIEKLTRLIDPEIGRLYRMLNDANWLNQAINPRTWLGGASDQVLSIAGFISVVSLDLAALPATGIMATLEPYYVRLERACLRAARAMRSSDGWVCASSGCDRSAEIVKIAHDLCIDPQIQGATLTAIENLVSNFTATTLPVLRQYFGWNAPASVGPILCDHLHELLPAMVVAYASINELPFTIRWKVQRFRDDLAVLVDRYRAETLDAPKGTPNPTDDAFVKLWNGILACLCRFCGAGQLAAESYMAESIDPQIATFYDTIVSDLFAKATGGTPSIRPMYGAVVPDDTADRVNDLMVFFTAAFTHCKDLSTGVATHLNTMQTTLATAYGQLTTALAGSTICGAVMPTLNCGIWPVVFECVRAYRRREGEMPRSIRDEIDRSLAPLVERLYMTLQGYTDKSQIHIGMEFDPMLFELDALIHYFRQYCLAGADAPKQSLMQSDLSALQAAVVLLKSHPDFVNVDVCESTGMDTADRRIQMIAQYRTLCAVPPDPIPQNWPSVGINTLLAGFENSINDTAARLGLDVISFTPSPSRGFREIFGDVVRVMMVAFGAADELPIRNVYDMMIFADAMDAAIMAAGITAPTINPASCAADCGWWLDRLACIAKACRYREVLQFFNGAEVALATVDTALATVYADALIMADVAGLEFLPHHNPCLRCDRVRLAANYIAAVSMDYAKVALARAQFTNLVEFAEAFNDDALHATRQGLCSPEEGPYDPLRKRVVINRSQLAEAIRYDDENEPIDRIVIEPLDECPPGSDCVTYIHAICWLGDREYDYNASLPSYEDQLAAGRDMAYQLSNLPQPIWRPNTVYAIQVETRDVVEEVNSDGNPIASVEYPRTYTFGFRTAGPLGHFHIEPIITNGSVELLARPEYQQLVNQDRQGDYRLADLRSYINRDKSYPDPDGNIIGAKPLYYTNATLAMVYNVDYVDSMYTQWNSATGLTAVQMWLETVIKDAAKSPTDTDIVINGQWSADEHPTVRGGMRTFRNMMTNMQVNGRDCLQFDPAELNPPAKKTVVGTGTQLKPEKLYTAIFNAVYKPVASGPEVRRPVHKYIFQTSRYSNFQEHVNSIYLDAPLNTKKAVFVEKRNITTEQIARAVLLLNSPNDASLAGLTRDYAEPFDRLVNGILGLGDLEAPTRTEIIVVAAQSTVLGLLVRSPEPFNNPKIPRVSEGSGKVVSDSFAAGGAAFSAPQIMFARDMATMFVTNTGLNIQTGAEAQLTFKHLLYNGVEYVEEPGTSTTITFTIPTVP